jgi:hypothetical protein
MSYGALEAYSFYFTGAMVNEWPVAVHGGSRTIPGRFGAMESRMGKALLNDTHQAALQAGEFTEDDFRRIVLWLDCNSNELGAYYDVEAQKNEELVWPRLDVDPADPLGVERHKPDPGLTDVIRQARQRFPGISMYPPLNMLFANNCLMVQNPEKRGFTVSIYTLTGKKVYENVPEGAPVQVLINFNNELFDSGLYVVRLTAQGGSLPLTKIIAYSR